LASPLERMMALLTGNLADVQTADATAGEVPLRYLRSLAGSSIARGIAQHLGVAIYFFGPSSGACKAPIVGGG
jgi:hypothetical protein